MPLFIIIFAMKSVHYVAFFPPLLAHRKQALFCSYSSCLRCISRGTIFTILFTIMLFSTLNFYFKQRSDECNELQGYLRGIRIPLLTLCNTLLFGKLTMAFPQAGVASLFYWFGWSRPTMLKPLKYFFQSSYCSPIKPWNIKRKLSWISPSSMIYDFHLWITIQNEVL